MGTSNGFWALGYICVQKFESGLTAGGMGTDECEYFPREELAKARECAQVWAVSRWSRSAQIRAKGLLREWWGTEADGTLVDWDVRERNAARRSSTTI